MAKKKSVKDDSSNEEKKIESGVIDRSTIIDFLRERGLYEDVDVTLIEELLFNHWRMQKAKAIMVEKGIEVPINNDKTLFGVNQICGQYDAALKQYLNISRKLGLSARDRKEIGLEGQSSAIDYGL